MLKGWIREAWGEETIGWTAPGTGALEQAKEIDYTSQLVVGKTIKFKQKWDNQSVGNEMSGTFNIAPDSIGTIAEVNNMWVTINFPDVRKVAVKTSELIQTLKNDGAELQSGI